MSFRETLSKVNVPQRLFLSAISLRKACLAALLFGIWQNPYFSEHANLVRAQMGKAFGRLQGARYSVQGSTERNVSEGTAAAPTAAYKGPS
jgi:hypothetical protein